MRENSSEHEDKSPQHRDSDLKPRDRSPYTAQRPQRAKRYGLDLRKVFLQYSLFRDFGAVRGQLLTSIKSNTRNALATVYPDCLADNRARGR